MIPRVRIYPSELPGLHCVRLEDGSVVYGKKIVFFGPATLEDGYIDAAQHNVTVDGVMVGLAEAGRQQG